MGILNYIHIQMNRQLRHIAMMILLAVSACSASGQEVLEQAMFCRTEGRIVAEGSAMRQTAEDSFSHSHSRFGALKDSLLKKIANFVM